MKAGTLNSQLPPSVEAAYYRKCIELRRRITEIESHNDSLRLRKHRIDRTILKMRLERAVLLQHLQKCMTENVDDSEPSDSPPPTPSEKPFRTKRGRTKLVSGNGDATTAVPGTTNVNHACLSEGVINSTLDTLIPGDGERENCVVGSVKHETDSAATNPVSETVAVTGRKKANGTGRRITGNYSRSGNTAQSGKKRLNSTLNRKGDSMIDTTSSITSSSAINTASTPLTLNPTIPGNLDTTETRTAHQVSTSATSGKDKGRKSKNVQTEAKAAKKIHGSSLREIKLPENVADDIDISVTDDVDRTITEDDYDVEAEDMLEMDDGDGDDDEVDELEEVEEDEDRETGTVASIVSQVDSDDVEVESLVKGDGINTLDEEEEEEEDDDDDDEVIDDEVDDEDASRDEVEANYPAWYSVGVEAKEWIDGYRVYASLVLSRPPVLTRELTSFEQAYFMYQRRLNERLCQPFNRHFYMRKGSVNLKSWERRMRARGGSAAYDIGRFDASGKYAWRDELLQGKEAEICSMDNQVKALVNEANEAARSANTEMMESLGNRNSDNNVQHDDETYHLPNPRITAEDGCAKMQSLNRRLDKTIYLMVQTEQGEWRFPRALMRGRDGLRKTTERIAHQIMKDDAMIWIVGNNPIGYYEENYDKAVIRPESLIEVLKSVLRPGEQLPHNIEDKQIRDLGDKTFFMKARINPRQRFTNLTQSPLSVDHETYRDFKWLTRTEIRDRVGDLFWKEAHLFLPER